MIRRLFLLARAATCRFAIGGTAALLPSFALPNADQAAQPIRKDKIDLFQTSDRCFACHNGLSTSAGEDISIGFRGAPTMMANSARDPYWQAGVRRETIDHASGQRGDRRRMFEVPHADGALSVSLRGQGRRGLRASGLRYRGPHGPARAGWRIVLALSSDSERQVGNAGKPGRRIRHRHDSSARGA